MSQDSVNKVGGIAGLIIATAVPITGFYTPSQTFSQVDVRQEDRRADRQQDRQADRQQDRQVDRQQDRHMDRQQDRQADRPADRQADRRADRGGRGR